MFTGIITALGQVRSIDPIAQGHDMRLVIDTPIAFLAHPPVALGASIACSGCCLTAVEFGADWFVFILVDDEDRENEGDLYHRRGKGHSRSHQFHGAARPRIDLSFAQRRALRKLHLPQMTSGTPRDSAPRSPTLLKRAKA